VKKSSCLPAVERQVDTRADLDGRWVSTVWLGLDHSFGSGPPLIFETMVFRSKDGPLHDLECDRYSTEVDALAGHSRLCEKWSVEQPEADDAVAGTEA
jgi:hypothetical protein